MGREPDACEPGPDIEAERDGGDASCVESPTASWVASGCLGGSQPDSRALSGELSGSIAGGSGFGASGFGCSGLGGLWRSGWPGGAQLANGGGAACWPAFCTGGRTALVGEGAASAGGCCGDCCCGGGCCAGNPPEFGCCAGKPPELGGG